MSFIRPDSPRDIQLLAMNNLPLERFTKILSAVKQANDNYYQLSETHALFHKMLRLGESEIGKDPDYKFMQPDEKQDWLKIRNLKTGDRSFINRYMAKEFEAELPSLYLELVSAHLSEKADGEQAGLLTISDEIDALLLSASVPGYFRYLEQSTLYQKGVFSKLRRVYISYMQVRAINVICHFLKAFETDLSVLDHALLDADDLEAWPKMAAIISDMCERADPHHHDPISAYAVNCLRSISVSIFNTAITLLQAGRQVPGEIRGFLPTIPDKIDFSTEKLKAEEFWERYQDHLFLFQRLPDEERTALEESLCRLMPAQRVCWIGCLGKSEIRNLVLPILARGNHFEKLAMDCGRIPQTDGENFPLASRVMDVLSGIYHDHLRRKKTVSKKLHQLFFQTARAKTGATPRMTSEERVNLAELRKLSFLVVDDSDRIRQMTVDVLRQAGISRVEAVSDGTRAWAFLQEKAVDVVLCDWIMPEVTGIELARRIMNDGKLSSRLTFLMLTTVNSKASIVEALSFGVRGYLIKPFTRRQLFEKVYFATEWLRREQQAETIQ